MPFNGGDSAGSERKAPLDAILGGAIQDLQRSGKLGHGPGQIPQDTVLALVACLSAAELHSVQRAKLELTNSFEIARAVLSPQAWQDEMQDPFLREVLLRVAALTAAGRLEEGARAIDHALAQAQQGYPGPQANSWLRRMIARPFMASAHRRQKAALLLAVIRQGSLLRDPERVARATLARCALYHPERPAWSRGYTEQMEAMHQDGLDDDMNFPLRVASCMAHHRAESARTPEERGSAYMKVATPLLVLADRAPSEAVLNEARAALMHASQQFRTAELEKELALSSTCIAAVDERLAQHRARAPAPGKAAPQREARSAQQPAPPTRAHRHVDVQPATAAAPSPPPEAQPSATPQAEPQPATDRYFMQFVDAVPGRPRQDRPGAEPKSAPGEAKVQQILADLQAQGRIGDGPKQVPEDCAAALLRAMAPDELARTDRATREVTFAISSAIGVLQRYFTDSPDVALRAVLKDVARRTADGDLQGGADAIDEALTHLETGQERLSDEEHCRRLQGLLEASWRQSELLRDVDRAVAAAISLAALSGTEQPASSAALAAHIESLHTIGGDKSYCFPLRVAVALCWLRLEAAQTEETRGEALLKLGSTQFSLGCYERDGTQLTDAVLVFQDACDAYMEGANRDDPTHLDRWVTAKTELGRALKLLGERTNSQGKLEDAVHALRDAIGGLQRIEGVAPQRMADAQLQLAFVLRDLSEQGDDIVPLLEAVPAFRAAKQAYIEAGLDDAAPIIDDLIAAAMAAIEPRLGKEQPMPGFPGIRVVFHPKEPAADADGTPSKDMQGDAPPDRQDNAAEAQVRQLQAQALALQRDKPPAWRAKLMGCNLRRAIAEDRTPLPPTLAVAAARLGELPLQQAEQALADAHSTTALRHWLDLATAPGTPEARRTELAERALHAAHQASPGHEQALAWARLSVHAEEAQRNEWVAKALDCSEAIDSSYEYLDTARELAPLVGPDGRLRLVDGLVARMNGYHGWEVLLCVLPYAPKEEWEPLYRRARPDARPLDHLYGQGELHNFAAVIYPYISDEGRAHSREMVLEVAQHGEHRARQSIGLMHLAAMSTDASERNVLIDEALPALWAEQLDELAYFAWLLQGPERHRLLDHATRAAIRWMGTTLVRPPTSPLLYLLEPRQLQRVLDVALRTASWENRRYQLEFVAPALNREQVRQACRAGRPQAGEWQRRVALLDLCLDWPELGQRDASLGIDTMLKREESSGDFLPLMRSLYEHVEYNRRDEFLLRGLRWWLQHLPEHDDETAAEGLHSLWPRPLDVEFARRITSKARKGGQTAEQLQAALKAFPEPRYPDIRRYYDREPPDLNQHLRRDLGAVRAWADQLRGHGTANSPLTLDDVHRCLDEYPKPLQLDCLEAIAHGLVDPHQVARPGCPASEWFVSFVDGIADAVHRAEGIEGVQALAEALRDSLETFE